MSKYESRQQYKDIGEEYKLFCESVDVENNYSIPNNNKNYINNNKINNKISEGKDVLDNIEKALRTELKKINNISFSGAYFPEKMDEVDNIHTEFYEKEKHSQDNKKQEKQERQEKQEKQQETQEKQNNRFIDYVMHIGGVVLYFGLFITVYKIYKKN